MNKKCADCGDDFSCDNDISCWCAEFPKLSSDEIDDRDCLCRTCLLMKYRKRILDVWNELKAGNGCTPATVLLRELKAGNGCTPATVLRWWTFGRL